MRISLILMITIMLMGSVFAPASAQEGEYTYIFVNLTDQPVDLYVNGEPAFLGTESKIVTEERVRGVSSDSAELYTANSSRSSDSALAAANMTPADGDSIILVAYEAEGGVKMTTITRS